MSLTEALEARKALNNRLGEPLSESATGLRVSSVHHSQQKLSTERPPIRRPER